SPFGSAAPFQARFPQAIWSEIIHRRDFNRALMVWIRNLTPDTQAILRAEQHKTGMDEAYGKECECTHAVQLGWSRPLRRGMRRSPQNGGARCCLGRRMLSLHRDRRNSRAYRLQPCFLVLQRCSNERRKQRMRLQPPGALLWTGLGSPKQQVL